MFPFPVSASAYISTSDEVPIEVHGCLRIHHDGRFERLAGLNTIPAGTDQLTGVQSKDVVISHETNLSVRLYIPKSAMQNQKLPTLIYYHGGGFLTESSASTTYHPTLNLITSESNVITVSVDYRLAPEYPIPIPYEDSWDAIKWVASHAKANGPEPWLNTYADLHNVFLAGDSSGANIAHNMAILVGLNPTRINLKGVILLHPYFQGNEPIGPELGKDRDFKAAADLTWKLASGGRVGLDDPVFNPAMDLRISKFGCSKILMCVAEKDKCNVRSLNYKEVMEKSGWKGRFEVMEIKGQGHTFFLFNTSCENARALRRRICDFINPIRSKV
ncbi:hypothetical protein L1987_48173 [Smallanthus sonchifolius]|uniref:Uncharacterized protein n=1 Tax=Smallanthus sonchifolius TaxID=185202 RepID=A0ACB9FS70_9ASTR|nr:hypothetical protein L1987_48173 [Smallanthus sonchifolius]